jgi:hypothetical protein
MKQISEKQNDSQWTGVSLPGMGTSGGCCEGCNEILVSVKGGEAHTAPRTACDFQHSKRV